MSILKRIIISTGIILILTSAMTFASPVNDADMKLLLSEQTACKNEFLNIDVYMPGKTANDLLNAKGNYKDIIVYRKQVKTDENGLLNVDFAVEENAISGLYSVVISGNKYNNSKEIFILNFKKSDEAIEKLNTAVEQDNTEEIKKVINEYYHDLYAENPKYNVPDVLDRAGTLVYKHLKNNAITLSKDNVSFIMNKAVSISALENGKLNNVIAEAERFGMNNGKLKDYYNKYYVTEAIGKRIAERLRNKKFDSFEKFDEELLEKFILSVVEEPDGSDNAKELLKAFSSEIGITNNGTAKQYTDVAGKSFDNYGNLKAAFEAAANDTEDYSGGNDRKGQTGSLIVSSPLIDNTEIHTHPLTIFDDLYGVEWAEDAIVYLAENLIVLGKEDKKFCPNDLVTREEFVKMLVSAFSINTVDDRTFAFDDVDESAWYYDYVRKAYCSEIVLGQGNNKFGIGQNITREDMAVMLKRVADYAGLTLKPVNSSFKFDDDDSIDNYAKESIYLLKENKIINGIDEYNYAPKANATRAQAAKLIYGLLMN